jgi:hypothetical protein
MNDPRDLVAEIEACPRMPNGSEERFAGYGVMGLPFGSSIVARYRATDRPDSAPFGTDPAVTAETRLPRNPRQASASLRCLSQRMLSSE